MVAPDPDIHLDDASLLAVIRRYAPDRAARDGDCLATADAVTRHLQQEGIDAHSATVIGWSDQPNRVMGFLHRATVVGDRVLDATAQQFNPELPRYWLVALRVYAATLAAGAGVQAVTVQWSDAAGQRQTCDSPIAERPGVPDPLLATWMSADDRSAEPTSPNRIGPPAPRPCESCPYRRDVPPQIWDATEYAKLETYDRPTPFQPARVFTCHQHGDRVCSGWAGCHDTDRLLGLRVAAAGGTMSAEHVDATRDYVSPVALFATGTEAAAHGRSPIPDAETDGRARALINKLVAQRGLGPDGCLHRPPRSGRGNIALLATGRSTASRGRGCSR